MANEAVKLQQGVKNSRRYQCADVAITKGTLLMLTDPNTASGSNIATGATPSVFAGIAAMDKVAGDGATDIAVDVDGVFDLTCNAGTGITAGALVVMSGANLIRAAAAGDLLTGAVVGKALETATASEVIAVAVGASV